MEKLTEEQKLLFNASIKLFTALVPKIFAEDELYKNTTGISDKHEALTEDVVTSAEMIMKEVIRVTKK